MLIRSFDKVPLGLLEDRLNVAGGERVNGSNEDGIRRDGSKPIPLLETGFSVSLQFLEFFVSNSISRPVSREGFSFLLNAKSLASQAEIMDSISSEMTWT